MDGQHFNEMNEYNYYNPNNSSNTVYINLTPFYYLTGGIFLYFLCWFCRTYPNRNNNELPQPIISCNQGLIKKIQKKANTYNNISKHNKIDINCTICLEDYKSTDMVIILNCNHIYHMVCILEWIRQDPSCPLCRTYPLF